MLFNSLELAVFPVVAGLYFLLPYRYRTLLLLVASCVFYMAFIPAYILILAVTIGNDYVAGILIERTDDVRRRRLLLIGSITATCLVLFVFKHFYFFVDNALWAAGLFGLLVYSPVYYEMQTLEHGRGTLFQRFQQIADRARYELWDYSDWPISRRRELFYNSQHLNADGAALFSSDLSRIPICA